MKQLVYAMHFRGQASPSADNNRVLKLTTSGTSCTLQTVVKPNGFETTLHAAPGDLAFIEGEINLETESAFRGSAVLTLGDDGDHELRMATVERGHLGPSKVAGTMAGSVTWHVQSGTGSFASATGLVTSVFTLNENGELSEYQCGLLFVPD